MLDTATWTRAGRTRTRCFGRGRRRTSAGARAARLECRRLPPGTARGTDSHPAPTPDYTHEYSHPSLTLATGYTSRQAHTEREKFLISFMSVGMETMCWAKGAPFG